MRKWIISSIVLFITIIYFLGPQPKKAIWNPTLPEVPNEPEALSHYVSAKESNHHVKANNEARIIWYDSNHLKTEYAVVYLHGFPASWKEGDPIHRQFAKNFGCNLYLARLSDHAIDTVDALFNFTVERYWESLKEALVIGKRIGDKVIIISTSTGGTGALMLAAHFPNDVFALLNLSPNIELKNPAAFLLNNHWGLQIARLYNGGKYRIEPDDETSKYWDNTYRLEATVQLERLVEEAMTRETFKRIKQPVLNLCYYKNEEEQDPTVSVSAIVRMHSQLSTPDSIKSLVKLAEVGAHAMGSDMRSKDVQGVYDQLEKFASDILSMHKVKFENPSGN